MTHRLQKAKAAKSSGMGIRNLVMSLSPTTHSRNQATLHPLTIRHESLFKAVWDWIVLLLVIYTAIEIPYTAAFVLEPVTGNVIDWTMKESPILQAVNIWVDLMFVLDILINFRTTYVEPKTEEIVSNPRQIALHYLKSWFVIDFVAALPFEFMVNRDQGATNLVGLLKTARLLRLVRVARKLDRYSEYGLAVVVLLTALFSLLAHWLACIWHAIGASEITNSHGWLYVLALEHGAPINGSQSTWPDVKTRYITSMYFTLSSLTSVGFGNISPNTNAEKVFSVCIMLGGALMYASIFGNMTAIIQRLYSRTSKYHNEVRRIDDFVKFYKIPKPLRERLEDYFRHEWLYTKGVDMNVVLKRFPESLQADICAHLHRNLFQQCSAFKTASEGCLRALALRFSARHFLPGHYIIKQGDEVKRLYFVAKGTIDVVQNGLTVISLNKGDVISCDSSYVNIYQLLLANASLLVTSHTEIHMIDWKELLVVLKSYPKFREEFLSQLDLAYNLGAQPQQSDNQTYDLDCIQITPEGLGANKQNTPGRSHQAPRGPTSFDPSLVNGQVPVHVETVPTEPFSSGYPLSPSSLGLIRNVERRINSLEIKLERMENKFATSFNEILTVLKNTKKKDHQVTFDKPESNSSMTTSV